MKLDTARLRPHLLAYLRAHGVVPTADGYIPCQNPAHADTPPYKNAHVVPSGEAVKCFSKCAGDKGYDVFQIEAWRSGKSIDTDFPVIVQAVAKTLGVTLEEGDQAPAPSHLDKPKAPAAEPVPLDWETASQKFTRKAFDTTFARKTWGAVATIGPWAARDEHGRVIAVDVRFENADGKKSVITHYWNGAHIVSKGAPLVLFGRDQLAVNPDAPVLISEGCKDWQASKAIPGFVPVTWNRGVENAGKAPWEALAGRTGAGAQVYYYGDDDAPGRKAARLVRERLTALGLTVKLCAPMVRGDGFGLDDVMTLGDGPEAVREWILNGPALAEESEDGRGSEAPTAGTDGATEGRAKGPEASSGVGRKNGGDGGGLGGGPNAGSDKIPFAILGIGDDKKAHFVDDSGRLQKESLKSISKPFLLTLTNLRWWLDNYSPGGKMNWDQAIDDIVNLSKRTDFDADNERGRGAWRERDGALCYHDGRKTHGQPGPDRLYLRKSAHAIGIGGPTASAGDRQELLDAVAEMSFDTKADTVRALSWAVLAPFGGALPYRPGAILTGESSSGKSTLLDSVIMPLVRTPYYYTGEASPAGARQDMGLDCLPCIIEEAEDNTKEGAARRKGFFSLMRQAYTDNAPKVVKGTPNGDGPTSYLMRQMYLFAAISPDTGEIADDNRLMTINMVKRGDDADKWTAIKARLSRAITDEVCAGVRSLTWSHLPQILIDAPRFARIIQKTKGMDSRRAAAEGELFAAFWLVWKDRQPDDDELEAWLAQLYAMTPPPERRNEAEEMVDLIFQYVLPLQGDFKERHTVEHYLSGLKTGWIESEREGVIGGQWELSKQERLRYRQTLMENLGIGLDKDGDVAFGVSNVQLRKITGREQYRLILERHPGLKRKTQTESVGGKAMRATVIRGLLGPDAGDGAPF